MIDGFLEMLMGKIQEVLICRLIMIDLDMGNGKDLYFFVCFFFAGTIQCHNGALHGLRGTREMHRSNLPKGVSSLPVSHIFTMFTSESSLLDESLAETTSWIDFLHGYGLTKRLNSKNLAFLRTRDHRDL